MPSSKKLISIISPAYNEEGCVAELAIQLTSLFERHPEFNFEVILIENGSTDRTYDELMKIHQKDARFKILTLSRNFRMDGGLTAGLKHATGDAAVIMASDLQDPVELIDTFIEKWKEGYENIYGVVKKRGGTGPIRRMNSALFYWAAGKLSGGLIPRNASDFRLVDRKVYESINTMQERNRFVRGLFAWSGFKCLGVEFERPERFAGVSNAHTLGVIDLALKGIFAHSYIPLKLISLSGLLISFLSFIALIVCAFLFVTQGVPFAGFGTIISLSLLMFGILFLFLGIMSEYIALIYEEVKQRPNYIVSEKTGL